MLKSILSFFLCGLHNPKSNFICNITTKMTQNLNYYKTVTKTFNYGFCTEISVHMV